MTLGEGVLGRARTRAERVRQRKSSRKRRLDSMSISRGNAAALKREHYQRFNTAISMGGKSKLRFPSLRFIRTGARIPALLLLSIAAWGLFTIFSSSDFQVIQAEISGIQYLSPSRVRTIAGVNAQSIFKVDPDDIEMLLESLPEVEEANVEVHWPNQVVIEIEERQPVMAWNDAGQTWILSADGLAFYLRGALPGLVHVQSLTSVLGIGEPLEPVIEKEKIKSAYDLSLLLGNDGPILYDERHGFGFRDERGWMAYFGSSGDMTAKFEIYEILAEKLAHSGYPATLVSVEDIEGPFYR
jgi:cell division septal protein FtsQ